MRQDCPNNSTGFTPLPGIVKDPGTGVLTITWPKGSGYTGVHGTDFVVQTSATLEGIWETLTPPNAQVVDSPTSVIYTFPTPLDAKRFARLKVTGP